MQVQVFGKVKLKWIDASIICMQHLLLILGPLPKGSFIFKLHLDITPCIERMGFISSNPLPEVKGCPYTNSNSAMGEGHKRRLLAQPVQETGAHLALTLRAASRCPVAMRHRTDAG